MQFIARQFRVALFAGLLAVCSTARADTFYVTESAGLGIDKVTSAGAVTRILSLSSGTAPTGLMFNSAGTLFAVTNGHPYLLNASAGGTTLGSFGGNHFGLAGDSAGNFYASQGGAIDKFTPTGIGSTFASIGLSGAQALAFDFSGNLYAANSTSDTIERFTPSGTASVYATGLNRPTGLAFDASGALFVSNAGNNTISRIVGGSVATFTSSGLNQPMGLAFDNTGTLYAADAGDGTIQKISRTGTASTFLAGLNGPYALAFLSSAGTPVAVPFPEPTSAGWVTAAILGLRRRRGRQK